MMKGEVSMGPDASQWFGALYVDNVRDAKGRGLPIRKFLAIKFVSPVRVYPEDFLLQINPWKSIQPEVESLKLDPWTYLITARWVMIDGYTFTPHDAIGISINGNLPREIGLVKKSFRIAADRMPDDRDYIRA